MNEFLRTILHFTFNNCWALTPPLPPPPIQIKHLAIWQKRNARGMVKNKPRTQNKSPVQQTIKIACLQTPPEQMSRTLFALNHLLGATRRSSIYLTIIAKDFSVLRVPLNSRRQRQPQFISIARFVMICKRIFNGAMQTTCISLYRICVLRLCTIELIV